MADLDLIPTRYHRRRSFQARVTQVGIGTLAILILLLVTRLFLDRQIVEGGRQLEGLRAERARAENERIERERIGLERQDLAQMLAVLEGLRGGMAAKDMFAVVDSALDENIWFQSFRFRREGEIVDQEPEAVATGYFVVIPAEVEGAPSRSWRLRTHMEILAEASDHSSLAGFVRRLSERPEVERARILNTQTSLSGDGGRVQFEVAVIVGTRS